MRFVPRQSIPRRRIVSHIDRVARARRIERLRRLMAIRGPPRRKLRR
jgi:hypothetical protein